MTFEEALRKRPQPKPTYVLTKEDGEHALEQAEWCLDHRMPTAAKEWLITASLVFDSEKHPQRARVENLWNKV